MFSLELITLLCVNVYIDLSARVETKMLYLLSEKLLLSFIMSGKCSRSSLFFLKDISHKAFNDAAALERDFYELDRILVRKLLCFTPYLFLLKENNIIVFKCWLIKKVREISRDTRMVKLIEIFFQCIQVLKDFLLWQINSHFMGR